MSAFPLLPHLRPTDGLRSRWNAGVFGAGLPSAFSLGQPFFSRGGIISPPRGNNTPSGGSIFAPNQWGVGVGAEVPIHYIRGLIDSGEWKAIGKFDGSNAFNEVSRLAILKAVKATCPMLFNYVKGMYEKPSMLFTAGTNAELIEILSREGTKQGDPLGGFIMTIVLTPHIRDMQKQFPHIEIVSLFDDIFALSRRPGAEGKGELEAVRQAMCSDRWVHDGLLYGNQSKTIIRTVEELVEQPLGVLGSWITAPADLYPDGEVNYKPVTDAIMDKLTVKCRALTGVIGYLPKQVGLLALRTCCLPILQHVIRTTPEEATLPACRQFDGWVENRLLSLARLAGNTEYGKNIAHPPCVKVAWVCSARRSLPRSLTAPRMSPAGALSWPMPLHWPGTRGGTLVLRVTSPACCMSRRSLL